MTHASTLRTWYTLLDIAFRPGIDFVRTSDHTASKHRWIAGDAFATSMTSARNIASCAGAILRHNSRYEHAITELRRLMRRQAIARTQSRHCAARRWYLAAIALQVWGYVSGVRHDRITVVGLWPAPAAKFMSIFSSAVVIHRRGISSPLMYRHPEHFEYTYHCMFGCCDHVTRPRQRCRRRTPPRPQPLDLNATTHGPVVRCQNGYPIMVVIPTSILIFKICDD